MLHHTNAVLLQRQHAEISQSAMLKTIAFVLSGRRTLSENLPAETISVHIAIAQRSRYLRSLIEQQDSETRNERQIVLRQIDCIGFRFYIEWLQTGRIEFHAIASKTTGSGLLLRHCSDLFFAHIVGTQFNEPTFQDYIIDVMAKSLDTSQTPDLKVLEVVFLERGASPILQRFVVDRMFALERKMLGMIRGSVEALVNSMVGCEYHVHGEGQCYKTGPGYAQTHMANTSESTDSTQLKLGSSMPFSLASFDDGADTRAGTNYNMSAHPYSGSAEWSKEVRGSKCRESFPFPCLDKALPPIPPLRPGTSPSPPGSWPPPSLGQSVVFPPAGHLDGASSQRAMETFSTQQLVLECLGRLPRDIASMGPEQDVSPRLNTVPIPELVLECLERLKYPSSGSMCSHSISPTDSMAQSHNSPRCSETTSPPTDSENNIPFAQSSRSTTQSNRSNDEQSSDPLHHQTQGYHQYSRPEADEISLHPRPQVRAQTPRSHHFPQATPHQLPFILSPTRNSTIARKPAPPRGTDWLKQYDRIHAMMQNNPAHFATQPAKRSKKARFRELLRSDSAISRAELDRREAEKGTDRREMMPRWA